MTTIVITRPGEDKSSAAYLYNVILKRKDWIKVTMMVDADEKMMERLDAHKIKYFPIDAKIEIKHEAPNHKDIMTNLISAVNFYDSILNSILTDDQMMQIMSREAELAAAVKAKEEAEAVLKK